MKVPPKRKGNLASHYARSQNTSLNESPSEKEGKLSPSTGWTCSGTRPSMKVPPKRKGNPIGGALGLGVFAALNESPSEKEGKFRLQGFHHYAA